MNQGLKKILVSVYSNTILPIAKKANVKVSQSIPQHEISEKHLKNIKMLTTREELLALLPNNGIVAELGVDEGSFSSSILAINKPKKLHLIDFWGTKRYNQNKRRSVESKFQEKINNKSVEINLGLSTEVFADFEDSYFDWIYIDTCHTYKTTIQELELYRTKIKAGGYIAGHDYILGNWNGLVRYGVIEAVYEFCNKYNWEIVYITMELNTPPSFAIRQIVDDNPPS